MHLWVVKELAALVKGDIGGCIGSIGGFKCVHGSAFGGGLEISPGCGNQTIKSNTLVRIIIYELKCFVIYKG